MGWGEQPECGVSPAGVVARFDGVVDRVGELAAGRAGVVMDELVLHGWRGSSRLRRCLSNRRVSPSSGRWRPCRRPGRRRARRMAALIAVVDAALVWGAGARSPFPARRRRALSACGRPSSSRRSGVRTRPGRQRDRATATETGVGPSRPRSSGRPSPGLGLAPQLAQLLAPQQTSTRHRAHARPTASA